MSEEIAVIMNGTTAAIVECSSAGRASRSQRDSSIFYNFNKIKILHLFPLK